MHIYLRSIFVLLTAIALSANAAEAQGRGSSGPKNQPVKTTAASHAPKAQAPKSSPAPKANAGGGAAHAPKTVTAGGGKTPKTTANNGKSPKTTTAATTPSTTTATASTPTLTPVQQKLEKNTNLASKLESRLPKGTDLMAAAEGFRNLGQFVSAVNVSNNLDIPFAELKASMVDDKLSLGQSIKKLRPSADAKTEASRAETQATVLINSTTTTTTTSTTTSTKKKNNGASQE
jgi:hypothetical protein